MAQNSPTNFLVTANDFADYDFQWSPTFKQSFSFTLEEQEKPLRFDSIGLQPLTKVIQKPTICKRSYINISNELRAKLIEAVHKNGEKVKYAAKRLGINYSSAKVICQIYKKEGRSERRLTRRRECFESTNKKFHEQVVIPNTVFSFGSTQVSNPDKESKKLSLNEVQNPPPSNPDEFKKSLFSISSTTLMKGSLFSDKSSFQDSDLSLSTNLISSKETEMTFKTQENEPNNVSMVLEQNSFGTAVSMPQNMPIRNPNAFVSQMIPLPIIHPQIQSHYLYRKDSCIQPIPFGLPASQHQQVEAFHIQNGNIRSNGFSGRDQIFCVILPQANYMQY